MRPTINADGSVISSALDGVDSFPDARESFYNDGYLYEGQIVQVYPVDDSQNVRSGSPGVFTVYDVLIRDTSGGTQIASKCRAIQPMFGGSFNNFLEVLPVSPGQKAKDFGLDTVLRPGTKVLLAFICGQRAAPVIIGAMPHDNPVAVRARPKKAKGTHLEMEFQGLNVSINNDGALKIVFNTPKDNLGSPVSPDRAPTTLQIDSLGNVQVDTNANQQLKMDRVAKTIKVTNGGTSILMDQNSTLIQTDSKDTVINATAACKINTGANTEIKAGGKCTIDAPEINFNGAAGPILTEVTDPIIDYIYGAPTQGVKTVKSG